MRFCRLKIKKAKKPFIINQVWRRGWDSNPRGDKKVSNVPPRCIHVDRASSASRNRFAASIASPTIVPQSQKRRCRLGQWPHHALTYI